MKTKNCLKTLALVSAVFMSITTMTIKDTQAQAIMFGSDVHFDGTDKTPLITLYNAFQTYRASYYCDVVCLIGDQGSKNDETKSAYEAEYKRVRDTIPNTWTLTGVCNFAVTKILTSGNHDKIITSDNFKPYNVSTGQISYTSSSSGTASGNSWAEIFAIDSVDFTGTANSLLKTYLAKRSTTTHNGKIIFVLSHLPLHSTRPGINQDSATAIFNTLNKYGDPTQVTYPLDIVFLWGHNHSSSSYDAYVNMYATRDEKIGTAPSVTTANFLNNNALVALKFTCMNAGYVTNGITSFAVYSDSTLTIKRSDWSSAKTIKHANRVDPYKYKQY